MTGEDERAVLERTRAQCLRLLDDLRRGAADLGRPSRLVTDEVLAEGRAVHEQAAAAAEALLRKVEEALRHP